jgi:hypothetical protein
LVFVFDAASADSQLSPPLPHYAADYADTPLFAISFSLSPHYAIPPHTLPFSYFRRISTFRHAAISPFFDAAIFDTPFSSFSIIFFIIFIIIFDIAAS